jgi:protein O-mannosyl-transferase
VTPPRLNALVGAGVALLAVALHAGVLGHGFLNWDDNRFVTANPLFAEGGWTYVRAALTRVQFEAYHPLHLLSYLPDRWLWPDRAVGFHGVSLALFALDVFLLFRLARRHAGLAGAATAALLFAAHPLCVEPVAWISARKDLLASAFFVGVFLVEDARDPADRRLSPVGIALFAAAVLSKTSALCLPPLLCGWLIWMRGTTTRAAAVRAAPYALLAIVPSLAVLTVWRGHWMIPVRPTWAPLDVLATLGTYARRVFWPNDLGAIYPESMPAPVLTGALVLAFAVAAALAWRRLPPPARFAVAAFPIALLPVANVVPVVFRFADRYAFLALGMLVPPAAIGLQSLFRAPRPWRFVAIGGVALAAASLAATSLRLAATWRDSRALWARATAAQPEAFMARLKHGETLRDLGEWAPATAEYQAAIHLRPNSPFGYAGLFNLYGTRAEAQGRLPPGTASGWLADLGPAMEDPSAFDGLLARVPRRACPECANSLLLLDLRRWPRSDEALRRSARSALDHGLPDAALVLLSQAVDQQAPDWMALYAESRAAAGLQDM